MTRKETQAFIDSLIKLRDSITDELALTAVEVYPQWDGNGEAYEVGQRVQYNGTLYKVIIAHISQEAWTPAAAPSLFAKVLIPDVDVIPEWEQPDSTNPYMVGDKVTYNGKTYVSIIDNNIWAPDIYGWEEV